MHIPKILHQTSDRISYPRSGKRNLKTFLRMNKGWDVRYYNDGDCLAFISNHYPELLGFYKSLRHPVQKADFFRYAVVHQDGGFYADMDMEFKAPLDELCKFPAVFAEECTIPATHPSVKSPPETVRIANYMFGTAKNHPFLMRLIGHISCVDQKKIACEEDILESTGPAVVTQLFHDYVRTNTDIMLLRNEKHNCPKCRKVACHYGDFALHHHLGSWRWEYMNPFFVCSCGSSDNHPFYLHVLEILSEVAKARRTNSGVNIDYSTILFLGYPSQEQKLSRNNVNILLLETISEIAQHDGSDAKKKFNAVITALPGPLSVSGKSWADLPVYHLFDSEEEVDACLASENDGDTAGNELAFKIMRLIKKIERESRGKQTLMQTVKKMLQKIL